MRISLLSWRLLFVAAVVIQLVALYWPVHPDEASLIPGSDKLVHLGIFAAATFTAQVAGMPRRWVLALFLVHAPLSEVIQGTLINRDASVYDVMADVLGVLTGAWLFRLIGAPLVKQRSPVVAGTPIGRED